MCSLFDVGSDNFVLAFCSTALRSSKKTVFQNLSVETNG